MKSIAIGLVASVGALASVLADETSYAPTTSQVAELIGVDPAKVKRVVKPPHDRLKERMIWIASFEIADGVPCGLTISLIPDGRLSKQAFETVKNSPNLEYQTKTFEDGDVLHHSLGDRGDQGTFYITTLENHEGDWDMTLILSRDVGVDESKLPFKIDRDGIQLIRKLERIVRNNKAEQE